MSTILTPQAISEFEKNAVNFAAVAGVLPHVGNIISKAEPFLSHLKGSVKGGKSVIDTLKNIQYKKFNQGGRTTHSVKLKDVGHEVNFGVGEGGFAMEGRSQKELMDAAIPKTEKFKGLKTFGKGVLGAAGLGTLAAVGGAAAGASGGLGN